VISSPFLTLKWQVVVKPFVGLKVVFSMTSGCETICGFEGGFFKTKSLRILSHFFASDMLEDHFSLLFFSFPSS
jgi:hypothetical protein